MDFIVMEQHVEFVSKHAFTRHSLHDEVLDGKHCAQLAMAVLQYVIFEPGKFLIHTVLIEAFNLQKIS